MKTYLIGILFFIVVAINCQPNIVNLIVYSDFVNPKEVYDSLTKRISGLNITDSIRIIGRPIMASTIEIQIDSSRAIALGFNFENIEEEVSKIDKSKDINELIEKWIKNEAGNEIQLCNIASFHAVPAYYKPHLFLSKPEEFIYKGKKAVKVECYYKKGCKKQLIEFIINNIDKFSDTSLKTEFEITY